MAKSLTSGITAHIAVIDGQPTTTTQDIAEVYGRRHEYVLKIVRQRMAEAGEWGVPQFWETPYTNPQNGQTYTVVRMTKKGFHFVVGKFTGAKAVQHQIAFADEFERMEAALRQPATPAAPALGALLPQKLMADAVLTGMAAGTTVQNLVTRAVLKGGDDWKHQRYLVSFITDSKFVGSLPAVEPLPADATVLDGRAFNKLFSDASVAAWERAKKGVY